MGIDNGTWQQAEGPTLSVLLAQSHALKCASIALCQQKCFQLHVWVSERFSPRLVEHASVNPAALNLVNPRQGTEKLHLS